LACDETAQALLRFVLYRHDAGKASDRRSLASSSSSNDKSEEELLSSLDSSPSQLEHSEQSSSSSSSSASSSSCEADGDDPADETDLESADWSESSSSPFATRLPFMTMAM
jgi:hypothetical protein